MTSQVLVIGVHATGPAWEEENGIIWIARAVKTNGSSVD